MDQRLTSEWKRGSEHRIRVLIEDPEAAWFDDFTRFRAAGFEAAACTGPVAGATGDDAECPYAAGRKCALWEDADVVLCALPLDDARCRVALEGGRRHHPETPVVLVRAPRGPADPDLTLDTELIEGTYALRMPASVDARIQALRAAVWWHAASVTR